MPYPPEQMGAIYKVLIAHPTHVLAFEHAEVRVTEPG
jgi:hypothetical protein